MFLMLTWHGHVQVNYFGCWVIESFGKLDFSSYYSENMKAMEERYSIAKKRMSSQVYYTRWKLLPTGA